MSAKYKVIKELGHGGMGVVFRALHLGLGKEVALKVLLADSVVDESTLLRFKREVEACAALSHSNIVKILDFGDMEDGKPFYTMELLEARDLEAIVHKEGPLSPARAVDLTIQAADALAYVHDKGMIHRDIKPANMMVTDRGHLTLMDFGLVKVDGRTILTQEGKRLGTPRFMAPEALTGRSETGALDVYSLGIALWELLVGRSPYGKVGLKELVTAIVKQEVPPLAEIQPAVPHWYSELVARMVRKDPAARPTAAQVRDSCQNRGQLPLPASEGGRSRATRKAHRLAATAAVSLPPPQRDSRLGWLLGCGIAAVAAGALVLGWAGRPDQLPGPSRTTRFVPRVTFPEDREVQLSLPPDIPGGEVALTATVQGALPRRIAGMVLGGVLTLTSLPPSSAVTGHGPGDPRWSFMPVSFGTPGRTILRNLACWPSDEAVLVDLDNPEKVGLEAEVGVWGRKAPLRRQAQAAGHATFRWHLEGLTPATEYFLRVRVPGGWGGLEDYRFQTLSSKHGTSARYVLDQFARSSGSTEAVFASDSFNRDPDMRGMPFVRLALTQHWREYEWDLRLKLIKLIEVTRDPVSAAAVFPLAAADPDLQVQVSYVRALAAARHPGTLELARQVLSKIRKKRDPERLHRLTELADGVAALPGPETFDLLKGLSDDLARPQGNVLPDALIRADREQAGPLIRGILEAAPTPAPQTAWPGLVGAAFLGDDRSVKALEPFLDRTRAGELHATAVLSMASLDRPAAVQAVLKALERSGPDPALALAAGQMGLVEALPTLARQLAPGLSAAVRSTAALAVGLLAEGAAPRAPPGRLPERTLVPVGPGVVSSLLALLEDPLPAVRDTACWALGRTADPAGCDALRQYAGSPRDLLGRGAAALAERGDPKAAPALVGLLGTLAAEDAPASVHRRALIAIALGRLNAAGATALLEAQSRLTGKERLLAAMAGREASRALKAAPAPQSRTVWVDPIAPVERTGIRLEPGQSVDVRVVGWIGWGEASDAVHPAFNPLKARPGAPAMSVRASIGGRTFPLRTDFTRLVTEAPGELILTTLEPRYRAAIGVDPAMLPPRGVGFARVEIRR